MMTMTMDIVLNLLNCILKKKNVPERHNTIWILYLNGELIYVFPLDSSQIKYLGMNYMHDTFIYYTQQRFALPFLPVFNNEQVRQI